MANDITFSISRTRFDEDYSPAESSRLTTNFANLARGEHRQQNLRNALALIDGRCNDLAGHPDADRYRVELDIVSVTMQFEDGGQVERFPLIEVLDVTIVDQHSGERHQGIVGNNFSSYLRDHDFAVRLPSASSLPADFGLLHGQLFQHFLRSDAFRSEFDAEPVVCISVSTSQTYRQTGVVHPVLGAEYEHEHSSLTDDYFGRMGMQVRYCMPPGSKAPLAFYSRGDVLHRLLGPAAHRHDRHHGDVPEDLPAGDLQRERGRAEHVPPDTRARRLDVDRHRLRPRGTQPPRRHAGPVDRGAPRHTAPRLPRPLARRADRTRRPGSSRRPRCPHPLTDWTPTRMSTLLPTAIVGSLPKPSWLAEPERLWSPWLLEGDALVEGKQDALRSAVHEQERNGIDIVSDGEQTRQHFVTTFIEHLDGIDQERKETVRIRDRYDAAVPTVVGAVSRPEPVFVEDARFLRAQTDRPIKWALPGPMTMIDTLSDQHYKSREKLAWEFATILNQEALELQEAGVDVIQFDEPAFTVFHDEVQDWGVAALERAAEGLRAETAVHICYGYGIEANNRWKETLGAEWRQYEQSFPLLQQSSIDIVSLECIHSHVPLELVELIRGKKVMLGAIDVATEQVETPEEVAAVLRRALDHVDADKLIPSTNCGMAPLARGAALQKLGALSAGADIVRAELASVAVPAAR